MSKHPARLLAAVLVSAWIAILLMPGDSQAQLYRYTDKEGRIVITDNPPPGVRGEVLDDSNLAPSERETKAAPEAQGPAPMPVPGRRDQAAPMPKPGVRESAAPPEEARDTEMRKVADEEIQKQKEEVQRKLRERQQEKQRRLEEADRLEKEANKPMQPTQENINRQMKLLQEAQRLREMP